ncbi:hypothetical protein HY227_01560, partial [Candidatus Wolfebacteria bacterium]|nr:hypothetical protein [Candidatus Wolfebacteria bacterium]
MTKYIIGIDEVGRGALAGPVTVAAFLLPRNFQFPRPTSLKDEVFGGRAISNFQINSNFQNSKISLKNRKLRLKDSKKLS